jgi:hypothetical protein
VAGGHRETYADRRRSPVPSRRLGRRPRGAGGTVLDGLEGLAPSLLGSDLAGRWSEHPTGLINWLDGEADITPSDPDAQTAPFRRGVGCRLDLYLLFGDSLADLFLAAYEDAIGHPLADIARWDGWALARSYETFETWTPNYRALGRADLDRHHCDGATPNRQPVSSSNSGQPCLLIQRWAVKLPSRIIVGVRARVGSGCVARGRPGLLRSATPRGLAPGPATRCLMG